MERAGGVAGINRLNDECCAYFVRSSDSLKQMNRPLWQLCSVQLLRIGNDKLEVTWSEWSVIDCVTSYSLIKLRCMLFVLETVCLTVRRRNYISLHLDNWNGTVSTQNGTTSEHSDCGVDIAIEWCISDGEHLMDSKTASAHTLITAVAFDALHFAC